MIAERARRPAAGAPVRAGSTIFRPQWSPALCLAHTGSSRQASRDWRVIPSPVPTLGSLDGALHVPSLLHRKVDGGSAQGAARPHGSDRADTGGPGSQDLGGWLSVWRV